MKIEQKKLKWTCNKSDSPFWGNCSAQVTSTHAKRVNLLSSHRREKGQHLHYRTQKCRMAPVTPNPGDRLLVDLSRTVGQYDSEVMTTFRAHAANNTDLFVSNRQCTSLSDDTAPLFWLATRASQRQVTMSYRTTLSTCAPTTSDINWEYWIIGYSIAYGIV